jgi:2-polyprenyl-3-methyl-5-hydroxy-6-metoxy-1,4-benzoquinol methylase
MSDPIRKPETYYQGARLDLLDWAGRSGRRVLEVGCGAGANAEWLRSHGAGWIEGVEPHGPSAELATGRYDRVHRATIEETVDLLQGPFDLMICADVLEHLVDPLNVLRGLRQQAHPGSALVVSVPNVRHYRAIARIVVGHGFRPEVSGVFDSTHLRFFTRANLAALLRNSGWSPLRWGYPSYTRLAVIRSALGRLSGGVTDEWLAGAWFVVACPSTPVNFGNSARTGK